MKLKKIVGGTFAVFLLAGSAFAAQATGDGFETGSGLPGVFGKAAEPPVLMAQTGDPMTQNLEEQVRQLNGRIEELNFQILQMQEQMRKMQEDVDFRLQELEGGKKSDAGSSDEPKRAEITPPANTPPRQQSAGAGSSLDGGSAASPMSGDATQSPNSSASNSTIKSLGTITFDESGNVNGGSVGDQATIGSDPNGAEPLDGADNTVVAALPRTDNPEELYRSSYDFILSGQYATAEAGFADHVKRFPGDVKAADAHFWLGEAQLGQRKYRDAAETFLNASKAYPKSKKAPEMLLKLGVSLVGLNQRDVACATFAAIDKRYPNTSGALKERVAQEKAQASC